MAGRPSRNSDRLAAILDHLPDALLLVDPAGSVVNANVRALEAFRASGAARPLIGCLLLDVLPGFVQDDSAAARRSPAPAEPRGGEMVARALDGTMFPVEVYRTQVPWAGAEDHLLLVLREPSAGAPDSDLARASAQAQAVLRATEEAICGVDREGRVVLANPAAARLLGARVGEVAGKNLHTLALHTRLDGSPYPAEDSPVGQALRSGRRSPRRREIVWRADGSPVPVDVAAVAVKDGEDVVGAVAAITDVTRGVEDERRRQRLITVLETDLVPALAELAAGDLGDVEVVAKELARLSAAAADAVDYERLMSGQLTLTSAQTDLSAVIRDAVDAVAGQARARQVTVDVVVEPCTVAADSRRLALAVGELVRAAVLASAPGASVTVSTGVAAGRVRIGVRETRVADTAGENPLLRWLRPRRGRQPGRDPDLAYVQIVVERHGGRFLLEPGSSGARSYVVELPTTDAAGTAPPAPPPLAEPVIAPVVAISEGRAAASVIPLPTRPQSSSLREAEPVRALRSVSAPVEDGLAPDSPPANGPLKNGTARTVLVWPEVARGLGAALARRGAASAAVAKISQLSPELAARSAVLLVDPLAGPVSRRVLAELRAAALKVDLPVLVAAGLSETAAGATPVVDVPVLLAALRGPAVAPPRVLVIEPDPAIGAALVAGLTRHGMTAMHTRDGGEATMRSALDAPDLVLLGLDTESAPRGIIDWLADARRLPLTPLLAYSVEDLAAGYAARLRSGAGVLAVGARPEGGRFETRLAALVAHLGEVTRR